MKIKNRPKDQLFQTAARLFYQNGYRAVGVDTIAAEFGIGKMTLYRHYPSKDELIAVYLEDYDRKFWQMFEATIEDASTPRSKLLAFFTALQGYVTSQNCHGCAFLNIASEYPETAYVGHQIALNHKLAVRDRFRRLAASAGARQPKVLADGLYLLMDGAYMAARLFGTSPQSPAANVADTARQLIDAQCRTQSSD